jgi:hypothetical protein
MKFRSFPKAEKENKKEKRKKKKEKCLVNRKAGDLTITQDQRPGLCVKVRQERAPIT